MPTPDESEDIGSLHGNTHNSGSQGTGSLHANLDNSKSQSGRVNMDDSEFQGTASLCVNTDDSKSESEGRGSCANTPDNAESPATSTSNGSFNWDWEHSYSLEWADLAKFKLWHQTEERLSSIEFIALTTWTKSNALWSWCQRFVCRHQASRGEKIYEKKHLEWKHKTRTKKLGCSCHINIKQYPHISTILGHYVAEHDHKIGATNIAFTCLSGDTWE